MKNHLKIFLLVSLTLFITQQNLLAVDPLPIGADTSIISLVCSREYIADPYILLVQVGGLIKFKATNGAYSILINNADSFFEGVEPKETIMIDSDSSTPLGIESEVYTVRNDLPVGTEIQYTIVCLSSGRIIGGINEDAPPRIIIVPRDNE